MRKNSIKNSRINEEVHHELSSIIHGEMKDPRIHPLTSVVMVEVAPDLKTAKAYISVLGDEKDGKDTLEGLRSAEGYIRRTLAKNLNLRNTPEIKFILDQSIAYGVHMTKLIDAVNQNTKTVNNDKNESVNGNENESVNGNENESVNRNENGNGNGNLNESLNENADTD